MQIFLISLNSLTESWRRSLLSAVGVMVGSTAIVLLVSIAKGVQNDISSQVRDLGVNVLVVVPGRIESGTFNPNLGGTSYLKPEDATRLAKVNGVIRAEPFTFVGGGIRAGSKIATPLLAAATPGWFLMHPVAMEEGRAIEDQDDSRDVVVLGSLAKQQLFGDAAALNKPVTVNQRTYSVIGVTKDKKEEQSLFSMGSLQNLVYLPYRRLKKIQPDLPTARIMIQISPNAEPKRLVKELDEVLQQRLDRQQFQVLTQEDLLGLVYRITGILTWLLTGLTSIGLFVGGIGIMTVMLMSVTERSKEIGIRKTYGARKADIFRQFLFEGMIVSLFGGLLSLGISYLVDSGLYYFTPIKPSITFGIVLLAFGTSLATGILFSIWPASRAANLLPVEAIRRD